MFLRNIIEDNLPAITDGEVAHYAKIGSLCHLLPREDAGWSSAWVTPVQILNDRMELKLGSEVLYKVANMQFPLVRAKIKDTLEFLRVTRGKLETNAFQMRFSGNPDELRQWVR